MTVLVVDLNPSGAPFEHPSLAYLLECPCPSLVCKVLVALAAAAMGLAACGWLHARVHRDTTRRVSMHSSEAGRCGSRTLRTHRTAATHVYKDGVHESTQALELGLDHRQYVRPLGR